MSNPRRPRTRQLLRSLLPTGAALLVSAVAAPAEGIGAGPDDPELPDRGIYVVVDLDDHTVSLRDGSETLWSVPAGTGTGLTLETPERDWEFSTPTGRFEVKMRELNPVWRRPDWYFHRQGREPPPRGSPERNDPGALGHAAIYLGRGIAIHGTYRPDLLGRQVSHGCIRIPNEYAVRLFYAVRVGTPVLVVGHAEPLDELPVGLAVTDRPPFDKFGSGSTEELVRDLRRGLARGGEDWALHAVRLVERAIDGEDEAAAALVDNLLRRFPSDRIRTEYAAYLVHLLDRRAARLIDALDGRRARDRERALWVLVRTAMDPFDESGPYVMPWPSRALSGVPADSPTLAALREIERTYLHQRDGAPAG